MIGELWSMALGRSCSGAAGMAQPVVARAVMMTRMERDCEVRRGHSLFLRIVPPPRSPLGRSKANPIRPTPLELLHSGDSCGNSATASAPGVGIIFRDMSQGETP